jgi:hypothetical protein
MELLHHEERKGIEMKTQTILLSAFLMILSLLVSACGGSEPETTPTLSADAIQTLAIATFSSALTQTALVVPTNTSAPTSTLAIVSSSPTLGSFAPVGTSAGSNPTAACYRMSYVSDVTIPDNTPMTPGQTFTKTWRVRNSGSCAWDAGFKFAFTGGDNMNGVTYTLPQGVPANTEINISIDMTAPTTKLGSLRSNWRMSTATGQFFGDEIYVLILVGGTTATATTGTVTSSTATKTNTPVAATSTPTLIPTEMPTPITASP